MAAQGGEFTEAKFIFVCHSMGGLDGRTRWANSMGGLVARWFTEKEGGAEITRKLITLGKPHRGALNALNHLVNSLRKGIGPIDFARSRPSAHQLPPEYACIESAGGIVKTTGTAPPNCGSAMIADGMRFHDELDAAALTSGAGSYDVHPIVGFRQKMCPYMEPMRFNPRPSMADGRTVCFKKAVFSAPYSMYFANPAKRAPKSNPLHYSICSNYLKFKHRESPLIFQMLMVRAALGPAPLSALYHKRFFIKQHSLGRTVFLHATVPRFGQAV